METATLVKVKRKKSNIERSRVAQMMLKTTFRNNIDLTSIADNKANIMLSINAIIITVSMPLFLANIESLKLYILPYSILMLTCVTSIVFATIATRPAKLKGMIVDSDLGNYQKSIFFFGNFFRMDYLKYRNLLRTTLSDETRLEETIIGDMYMLGKVLGKKYETIRLCYSSFVFGIMSTAIGGVVVVAIDILKN
jgi:hypothetical protein